MALLIFVLKQAWREIRLAKQRSLVIILCIAVGISSIAAVQFYTTSMRNYFTSNIKALVGGDIILKPLAPLNGNQTEYLMENEAIGLFEYTRIDSFDGVLFSVGIPPRSAMVQVQQVDPLKYPLYGTLKIVGDPDPYGGRRPLRDGSILLDPSTMKTLGVEVGESVMLGTQRFLIGGELDDSSTFGNFENPFFGKVFISTSVPWELETSTTYLIKMEDSSQLEEVSSELRQIFTSEVILSDHGDRRKYDPVRTYVESSEQIERVAEVLGNALLVAGLSSLLLGGLGIYSAVSAMIRQRMSDIAVIKCFGGRSQEVLILIGTEIFLLTIIGMFLGIVAGIGLSRVIPLVIKDLISIVPDFYFDWRTFGRISLLGFLTAFLFSVIPILMAVKVKPLVLYRLQPQLKEHSIKHRLGMALLIVSMTFIFAWVISVLINSWRIGFGFTYGILALVGITYLPARLLIAIVCRIPTGRFLIAKLGFGNLNRQGGKATSSVLSIGLGIAAVLIITLLKGNVLSTIDQVMDDVRNYNVFLLAPLPELSASIEEHLSQQDYVSSFTSIPQVNVAVIGVNNQPLALQNLNSSLRSRLYNLSVSGIEPADVFLRPHIVEGEWLSGEKGEIVIDYQSAEEVGIEVGDTLQLRAEGQAFEVVVVGLSGQSQETGIQIRFQAGWVMSRDVVKAVGCTGRCAEPILIRTKDGIPGSVATADIRMNYPEVTIVIDVGQVFEVLYKVFNAITAFMQFIGLFSVLSGGVILSGMVISTKYQRRRDIAVIRCFGGNSATVLISNLFEYGVVGILAGGLGVAIANMVVKGLVEGPLRGEFVFDFLINTLYIICAACFTAVIGMISISDVLKEKPLTVLKYE